MNTFQGHSLNTLNEPSVAPDTHRLAPSTLAVRPVLGVGPLLAIAILFMLAPWSRAQDLYRNFNVFAVENGVTGPTKVFLTGPAQITSIVTYHWNFGLGKKPGYIKILTGDAPDVLPDVPYPAQGQPGSLNAPNVNWVATMNLKVAGGWYDVSDSDPATMSQNSESGHEGFVLVSGTYLPSTELAGNFNIEEVRNDGTPFLFRLTAPAQIDQLETYHWFDGRGSKPGSITIQSIKAPFRVKETYKAEGLPGSDNAPNVNWVAKMNLTLPPGTYEIVDSDPATWSQNAQTGGEGFAIVRGADLSPGLTILPPSKMGFGGPMPITTPCGNPGYRLTMTPCSGPWSSTEIEMEVVRPLPSPVTTVEFKYYEAGVGLPSGTPVPVFTTPVVVSGDGAAVGSLYLIAPPQLHDLCVAGQYSKWEMFPLHADGSGEGAIGIFQIGGCP
jgi:hypothetical protein